MDKRNTNSGFTLLEMMLVLLILSLLASISISYVNTNQHVSLSLIINEMALTQLEAIKQCDWQEYDDNGVYAHYNRLGNIRQADTYEINGEKLIITLATGRMYVKQ